ncbi:MAG: hypothetical protein UV61_C0016G0006 [Candidatus Gottesmanbacteria bacterium GW2011_GWB1_43_11]|uniref:Uncharacterized protein n=1 Tax=Candidatus Gottesmanbacteria bacterium GW2011_GWB1_43_11 TaxID=1618446 RepID=A0A0G1CJH0_9BACT|nr:MAG: hypothetical protein UV04_C0006G0046 [Candidatus Gottesmanbacteria bacterium GW2011_GWA2_42_16]KKS52998.1 MAG: hypothetical protein UV17_C0041G0007 [Candidatus Gottesmanbacteria bacterium GW2011_GWA1_42_26]KKS80841.1 MAG: hypothetical protein UV55_C0028G0014 [Candidatus Gottesmanbacteria bacterium GW2011_GWC1_43_10]KKS85634.1 MAG: hypothetical protein UV61_C0016G0006 [Candidatus Gottesmanbacteria bacterium GW2011_GWB1_43_11]OGG10650.1 MAG: hypothetical protein A2699_00285 [Candidatus Go
MQVTILVSGNTVDGKLGQEMIADGATRVYHLGVGRSGKPLTFAIGCNLEEAGDEGATIAIEGDKVDFFMEGVRYIPYLREKKTRTTKGEGEPRTVDYEVQYGDLVPGSYRVENPTDKGFFLDLNIGVKPQP